MTLNLNRSAWILFLLLVVGVIAMASNASEARSKKKKSQYFSVVGHLNYKYNPGVILPLRDGRILALGGVQASHRGIAPKSYTAADGKTYGATIGGMVELFDPKSGETRVLTRMPFTFAKFSHGERQMKAVELKDGRILMIGRFIDIRKPKHPERSDPFPTPISKEPEKSFSRIAPPSEPDMFGLLYDWHNCTFDIIRSTEDFRPRHSSTLHLLPSGKVLVFGGTISNNTPDSFPETRVLEFDPVSKELRSRGNLLHSRYGHAMVPISDTKVMLIGGFGPSESEMKNPNCNNTHLDFISWYCKQTKEVEIFDLETGFSSLAGHTLTGRSYFNVLPLSDGNILIHGGRIINKVGFAASELFDPLAGTSRFLGKNRADVQKEDYRNNAFDRTPFHFYGEGADFQLNKVNGKILIAGGRIAFIYDENQLMNSKYHIEPSVDFLNMAYRIDLHLIKTPDEQIFVVGGSNSFLGNDVSTPIEKFEYDKYRGDAK